MDGKIWYRPSESSSWLLGWPAWGGNEVDPDANAFVREELMTVRSVLTRCCSQRETLVCRLTRVPDDGGSNEREKRLAQPPIILSALCAGLALRARKGLIQFFWVHSKTGYLFSV